MRRLLALALLAFCTLSALGKDAAEIRLALRRLQHVGGALYIAAHPDDENTAMLSWLASDRAVRTGYLSMTRGDGGQNLIGEETGALLGVIRTHELLQARRIDGAEQMFTRAIDFGFTKSPDETMKFWGHDAVLSDVVWAIRKFQPDVLITRFPVTGEGGHGQHTASAILAEEAFAAAGDLTRFPEQLSMVSVWKPKRIFWNRFSFGRQLDPNDPALAKSLRVDLGAYNTLLGRAYSEIAAESRSQHKSQGFGAAERRGSILNYYDLREGDPATTDLFEGIDTSWSRYPGGDSVGSILKKAADTFEENKPANTVPLLIDALNALARLRATPEWSRQNKPWLDKKEQDLLQAIRDCAGIAIDVAAGDSAVIPGGELPVSVTVVNRSDYPFRLSMVASPYAEGKGDLTPLEYNKPVKRDIVIKVPEKMQYSQPYWLRRDPKSQGLYEVDNTLSIGRPDNPVELPITVTLDDPKGNNILFVVPAVYRWTDPVKGEQVRNADVVPPVSVKLSSNVYIFPDAKPKPVTVWLRSYGATEGKLWLLAPEGWKVEPQLAQIKMTGKGDETRATFTVTPPAGETIGALRAEFAQGESGGWGVMQGIMEIDYPHIPAQRVLGNAVAKLVRSDIKHRGTRVGYIMGSGDDVPNILRQVGYEVNLLTDADLDRGDFSAYDAIVTGVRAYNTRKRMRLAHEKLMQYVENGGTMVVQYNVPQDDLTVASPGPFPFKLTRDRVTVEEAPVRFVDPAHPVLNTPNKITAADFNGWIQERGLYFAAAGWDPRYTTVLASNDPGEAENAGGELVAKHGKGMFIYTSYAWWRQLPAGVPGAIRAFVNLVSAKVSS